MINCPSCGGVLKYDIASAQMKCASCDGLYSPYHFDKTEADAESHGTYDARVYVCPGCSARLETADEEDITTVCAYCGHPRIIFDRIEKAERPKLVIPFRVTKEDCKKRYLRASRRAFLTPGRLRSPAVVESFRGIYMPYWSYKTETKGEINFRFKGATQREGDYLCTDIYRVRADIEASFSDVSHDASQQFDDNVSEALGSFDSRHEKPFTPGYLNGFYAEAGNVPAEQYVKDAEENIEDAVTLKAEGTVRPDLKMDKSGTEFPDLGISPVRTLYPVWFLSARKKNKVTYAAINGDNGKVVADFPISPVKFFIFSLLIGAAVFGIMTLFNVILRPQTALMLTMAMAVAAWGLNMGEFNRLAGRGLVPLKGIIIPFSEKPHSRAVKVIFQYILPIALTVYAGISFLGTMFVRIKSFRDFLCFVLIAASVVFAYLFNKKKKVVTVIGRISLLLLAASIIISFIVLAVRPLNEVYYYVSVANSVIFAVQLILTFRYQNMLAYRRPPQFNKKGGDDNA